MAKAMAGMRPAKSGGRRQLEDHLFADDGTIPNSRLPLLVMREALRLDPDDPAASCESVFAANGWTRSWRNGIFSYHHYHSTAHEVLGIATGSALVRFGGEGGRTLEVHAGDVVVIPAGVGHKLIEEGDRLLVVGAYAGGRDWDIVRDPRQIEAARARVAAVPLPESDPVTGRAGLLTRLWGG